MNNFLENYNDLEFTVKTKNAPFFMNFPNINKNWAIFSYWTDPLRDDNTLNHTIKYSNVPAISNTLVIRVSWSQFSYKVDYLLL